MANNYYIEFACRASCILKKMSMIKIASQDVSGNDTFSQTTLYVCL